MGIKVIITGSTGMVGEGVLLECLQNPDVEKVIIINRKPYPISHAKLEEVLVQDFFDLNSIKEKVQDFDACFFCAGISSVGINEADYIKITYDMTLSVAGFLSKNNPNLVFTYVSGQSTDSSEQGKTMWARVKGKTENDLMKLPFRSVYNFRPGFMEPVKGQKNIKPLFKILLLLTPVFKLIFPKTVCTLNEVGRAMVNCVTKGYPENILEVADIKLLAKKIS